jgi:hypothetical protein
MTADLRADIADCAGLADLMTKIVAVQDHLEFPKLRDHLELIVGDQRFVQHYFTRQEVQDVNKVFELYMAALVLLVAESLSMDPPGRSRGDNPDVITPFQGRDWGLACKVVHSDNPRGYRNHLIRGVEQIEAAAVDRGIDVST